MARNTRLGSHTARRVGMLPLMAKVEERVENNMYIAERAMPIPMCNPVPPRTLRDDRETPIRVRIIAARGIENRL